MTDMSERMRQALAIGEPAILVRVARTLGSTPREAGAAMLVSCATSLGTVGGGALELCGIEKARAMIEAGEANAVLAVPLGPRIGQCCGGHVTLSFARVTEALLRGEIAADEARHEARPAVLLFGAGHTGRALAAALAPLPLRVTVIDTRPASLDGLPAAVEIRAVAVPEAEVAAAPAGAAFLVMTHDHALDFLIAAAALQRGDAAYVGMIGSATKRERFRRHLVEAGLGSLIGGLTLPIGRPADFPAPRDKRPEVIAALTAAEVLATLLAGVVEKPDRPFAGADLQCNSAQVDLAPPKARNARAT